MAAIGKLDVAWLSVSDFARARDFYGRVLGLKETVAVDEMGWAEMSSGADVRIALSRYAPEQGSPPPGSGAVPVIMVKDIDAAMGDLESKGVTFLHPVLPVGEMGKLVTFKDPDGNMLQLYQSLVPVRRQPRAGGARGAATRRRGAARKAAGKAPPKKRKTAKAKAKRKGRRR